MLQVGFGQFRFVFPSSAVDRDVQARAVAAGFCAEDAVEGGIAPLFLFVAHKGCERIVVCSFFQGGDGTRRSCQEM